MEADPKQAGQKPGRARALLFKAARFLVITALFGFGYGWAAPKAFPKSGRLGAGYGVLHGALMPMALPALVMGQEVEIYATNNSGRFYNIGYIVGINLCGLVFFGSIFWRPKPATREGEKVGDSTRGQNK